jgi:hypothetical protein
MPISAMPVLGISARPTHRWRAACSRWIAIVRCVQMQRPGVADVNKPFFHPAGLPSTTRAHAVQTLRATRPSFSQSTVFVARSPYLSPKSVQRVGLSSEVVHADSRLPVRGGSSSSDCDCHLIVSALMRSRSAPRRRAVASAHSARSRSTASMPRATYASGAPRSPAPASPISASPPPAARSRSLSSFLITRFRRTFDAVSPSRLFSRRRWW